MMYLYLVLFLGMLYHCTTNKKKCGIPEYTILTLLAYLIYSSSKGSKEFFPVDGYSQGMDKEAYTNLHRIVKELYDKDTLTIPGNVKILGKCDVKKELNVDKKLTAKNQLEVKSLLTARNKIKALELTRLDDKSDLKITRKTTFSGMPKGELVSFVNTDVNFGGGIGGKVNFFNNYKVYLHALAKNGKLSSKSKAKNEPGLIWGNGSEVNVRRG